MTMRFVFRVLTVFLLGCWLGPAGAQEKGVVDRAAAVTPPDTADLSAPAKELFGHVNGAAPLPAKSFGFYSKGCLAGARALPHDGETWQVMRLSRNRNWGHPELVSFVERLAARVPEATGWRGVLVGDMSQPRGGPMLTGHASHQIGLDADIWLTQMPDHKLSQVEREEMSATNLVRDDLLDVEASRWSNAHFDLIKTAAEDRAVERVLVNPAIKKALCRSASGDRGWLNKVRPYFGHNYHMHIRIGCPKGSDNCREQDATPAGDGCDASLDWWFSDAVLHPKPKPPKPPKPPLTLNQLPAECRQVLLAK
jgi:penicillin-insensitive murein DD-endopeptidase